MPPKKRKAIESNEESDKRLATIRERVARSRNSETQNTVKPDSKK